MRINNWIWPIYARIYDQLLAMPVYNKLIQEVINSLELKTARKILDAGCGTGNLELEILKQQASLTIEAIDYSTQMLGIAKKKNPNLENVVQVNLNEDLPYLPNTFDRIASIHVVYSLINPTRTLKEFFKILQPNGLLVIVNPRKGASVRKVVRSNLSRLKTIERPRFLLKMSMVIMVNLFIARGSKTGVFHFWESSKWEDVLSEIGFSDISVKLTYGNQSYLIIAVKQQL